MLNLLLQKANGRSRCVDGGMVAGACSPGSGEFEPFFIINIYIKQILIGAQCITPAGASSGSMINLPFPTLAPFPHLLSFTHRQVISSC